MQLVSDEAAVSLQSLTVVPCPCACLHVLAKVLHLVWGIVTPTPVCSSPGSQASSHRNTGSPAVFVLSHQGIRRSDVIGLRLW